MRRFLGRVFVLTDTEVAMMIHLTAKLDPDNLKHDEAKALIHKCRAEAANPSNVIQIVRGGL